VLLQFGARVNEANNVGDTPLHRAAHTNRLVTIQTICSVKLDFFAPPKSSELYPPS